jgi:2-haloacid dehalogenase
VSAIWFSFLIVCFAVVGVKTFGFTVYWVNRMGTVMDELGVAPDGTVRSLDEVVALLQ